MNYNVESIRAEFPHAVSPPADSSSTGLAYCVGGAVHLFAHRVGLLPPGLITRWPMPEELAHTLQLLNPRLSLAAAHACAERVVGLNDEGNLDDAWLWVHSALMVDDGVFRM